MERKWALRKIADRLGFSLVSQAEGGLAPKLDIPRRDVGNVRYDKEEGRLRMGRARLERRMDDIAGVKPLMQTTLVAKIIAESLRQGDYPSIRDVFYACKFTIPGTRTETFEEQDASNTMIEDVEALTGVLREEMGVVAEPQSHIAGHITLESEGNLIDCSKTGQVPVAIPPLVDAVGVRVDKKGARFVLIVEKGAIWTRLHNVRFWDKNRCIIITAGGQPDRAVRRMVRRLYDELSLPIYTLVDADPYGWYIASVYRIGSIKLSYESDRLACPTTFLGVSASDIERYKIPKNAIIKATEADLKRAKELLNYPWFQTDFWRREIGLFLERQEKVEIEAFSRFGLSYLHESYLPEKLREAGAPI